ncbi:MAG: ATP-binding protein [Chloroflexota bacterium]
MEHVTSARKLLQHAFPGLPADLANEMIASSKVIEQPAFTVLCREGEPGYSFYIIIEGQVKATKLVDAVEERLLKTLEAGDFFGEMALIHNAPRAATITTLTPTKVLEISKEAFDSLLARSASVSLAIIREISRRLRENDEMAIEDLRIKAAELADAYQLLAEEEYARNEFLTTVAHELRTPLTTANGFLQMIRSGSLRGDNLLNALDSVTRNVEEIVALVNDILFLQEMEMILPDFQSTDVGVLTQMAIARQRQYAEENHVRLQLEMAPGLPKAKSDPKSLGQAIDAIINNAIKFSPEGGDVNIHVGSGERRLWVKVEDCGVGIPPEALPDIFNRYFRLDQVGGYLFRGLGLGLSIAQQVVIQHGGEITVESELGKGSTFTLWLPAPESGG